MLVVDTVEERNAGGVGRPFGGPAQLWLRPESIEMVTIWPRWFERSGHPVARPLLRFESAPVGDRPDTAASVARKH